MRLFDSHSHYNDEKFDLDREDIIKETYDFGIKKFMCIGYDYNHSKRALEIASKYDFIYSSVGISPNDLGDFNNSNLNEFESFVLDNREKIKAIGEIGLDYYWNKENKDLQKEAFIKQIDLANKLDLPIIIHTRDAYLDTIKILREHPVKRRGIFHCCPLNQELIKDAVKLDFYVSFSGNITFKTSKPDECIKLVPDNRLLIETDSPYLTPEPLRGTRNNSMNVKYVAEKIALVKNLSLNDIAELTYNNACDIFNISK